MIITDVNDLSVNELQALCEAEGMEVVIEDGKITGAVSEEV